MTEHSDGLDRGDRAAARPVHRNIGARKPGGADLTVTPRRTEVPKAYGRRARIEAARRAQEERDRG